MDRPDPRSPRRRESLDRYFSHSCNQLDRLVTPYCNKESLVAPMVPPTKSSFLIHLFIKYGHLLVDVASAMLGIRPVSCWLCRHKQFIHRTTKLAECCRCGIPNQFTSEHQGNIPPILIPKDIQL